MLPASRAAWVPVCMATPTSACASAGASLVPSPAHGDQPAAGLLLADDSRASARAWLRRGRSSTPASEAMAAAVIGLSPVTITVLMPMARSAAKRSLMPGLTTSLRWTTPSSRSPSATPSGVPPVRAMASTAALKPCGAEAASRPAKRRMASTAPLRMLALADIDARDARLRRRRGSACRR